MSIFLRKVTSTAPSSTPATTSKFNITTKTVPLDPKATSNHARPGSNNNSSSSSSLPPLGRINPNHVQIGTKVWVSDPKVLWRIGEIHSVNEPQPQHPVATAQVYVPDAPDEKVRTIALTKLYAFDPSHIVDHDDIALMNNMHEAPLLNVLRQRFEQDKIYTFTADILLSINPYKTIPLLYDVIGFMTKNKPSLTEETESNGTQQPPHLFTIAENAYSGMKGSGLAGSGISQSIIVSGESGAGKTEATKYIMKYLATASKHVATVDAANKTRAALKRAGSIGSITAAAAATASVHEKIEECVVLSNLILESFGNAKTSRNDNSSRFGKYIQIHYNTEGRMAGVSIRHFLLEKTRLVVPQANERNYHIFYQLLAGLETLETHRNRSYLTNNVWNYSYLTRGDCVEVAGVDDRLEFIQLSKCMTLLGMDMNTFQQPLYELLAAILHLGNLQFDIANNGQSNSNNHEEHSIPKFPVEQGVDIHVVASLLGVDATEFASKMVTQTTITGRGSILVLQLTPSQAKNAMDAFCKYLYGELFHHLISRINAYAQAQTHQATRPGPKGQTASEPFIGILDIFGFEVMKSNSLEQLCINFTNEMLQQQFNKHVFVLEQARYASEGIIFSSIEFQDNQATLDLIQKPPTGLLPLLEEQMLLKRKTTDKQLLTIYHSHHLEKHSCYSKPRFESDEFIVRHYAGEVLYDINEFIAKNTDNLHDDLLDLLRRSNQPLLQAMFQIPEVPTNPLKRSNLPTGSGSGSGSGGATPGKRTHHGLTGTTTVSSRFRTQLTELMDVLWHTTPHYIKCIKPNNLKFPSGFSCDLVRDQLVYSGVLEVVRIRQEGFPIRKEYSLFYHQFWSLLSISRRFGTTIDARTATEMIVNEWLNDGEGTKRFAIGRSEVFLRYGQLERLETCLATLRHEKAIILQSTVRGWMQKRQYHHLRQAIVRIQTQWRKYIVHTRYLQLRRSTLRIQSQYRRHLAQKAYQQQQRAIKTIQSRIQSYLIRKRFQQWRRQTQAAVRVQSLVRGYLCRTAAERQRKVMWRSVVKIQTWYKMKHAQYLYTTQRKSLIVIQSMYRAIRTRRQYVHYKQASIVVSAIVRKWLQQRKFTFLKQRIVKCQALVRQWRQRRQFIALRTAVVVLQSKYRQTQAKLMVTKRKCAMQTLQNSLRGWLIHVQYQRFHQRVCRVQAQVQCWLGQRTFRAKQLATRRIQHMWRQSRRTRQWQREVARLFGCSTTMGSSMGKMEDSAYRIQKLRACPLLYFHLQPKAYGYKTLFHHAAACNDMDVIKYMVEHTENYKTLLDQRDGKGATAFHEACGHGQYEMAKYLLHLMSTRTVRINTPAVKRAWVVEEEEDVASDAEEANNMDVAVEANAKSPAKDAHGPEQDTPPVVLLPVGIVYQGYLHKRRETSRWMKRYVVLNINTNHVPQLEYYTNHKSTTLAAPPSKIIILDKALFKKSMDIPCTFEIHSPQLLHGRNKEGRLYFSAETERESQQWLAHLRNSMPSSLESRLFAMHRGNKHGMLECIDFEERKRICNLPCQSLKQETPLHRAAGTILNSNSTLGSTTTNAVSASIISISTNETNQSLVMTSPPSSPTFGSGDEPIIGKTRLEVEAEVVKTVLWLIENGADINTTTIHAKRKETPLKLSLMAHNYVVAKHLLDRGALATGLSTSELEQAQRLKASLAKNAISSISSSTSATATSGSSSRTNTMASLFSFRRKAANGTTTVNDTTPILFLQKQPGTVRNSSYVSVFVELMGITNPHYLIRPRMIISVLDSQSQLVEAKQQVSVQPLVLSTSLVWSFTWHMQTPLENLPHGACVVFELTITPMSTTVTSPSNRSTTLTSPTTGSGEVVPVCWTYIQVDQRTANSMPLNTEMYKYPMDLTLKKLQRVDAFMNGDIMISQAKV